MPQSAPVAAPLSDEEKAVKECQILHYLYDDKPESEIPRSQLKLLNACASAELDAAALQRDRERTNDLERMGPKIRKDLEILSGTDPPQSTEELLRHSDRSEAARKLNNSK